MLTRSLLALLIAITLVLGAIPAQGDDRDVERFATLPPDGPGFPEGIAADKHGNIYVATFDFSKTNVIYVFRPNGRLKTATPVPGAPLGLAVGPDGHLYVANFGTGEVHRFILPLGPLSLPDAAFEVQVCIPIPFVDCGLNAIAFDAARNLYVSDSFGGKIYTIAEGETTASEFFFDDRLKPAPPPHGFPPFGANGLAFSADDKFLFIANTADDRILKLDVSVVPPPPAALTTFAESINGADGMLFDKKGRLWVAANQADEVVALNEDGRIVERRGSFKGIGRNGAPRGLLFPASIVLSHGSIFVTNAALALTPAVGDEPEEDVEKFTVSRISLHHHGHDHHWYDDDD